MTDVGFSPWLSSAVVSVWLAMIAASIGSLLGIPAAWSYHVSQHSGLVFSKLGRLAFLSWVFASAVPLILHAAAWESAAGKFGWWWWVQGGAARGVADSFRNLTATGWVHAVHTAAVIAAGMTLATSRVDRKIGSLARLDGGAVWRWWRIVLPASRGTWFFLLMFTSMICATEMTVADLYFCQNIADRFYRLYAADPTTSSVLWAIAPTIAFVVFAMTTIHRALPVPPSGRHSPAAPPSPQPEPPTATTRFLAAVILACVSSLVAAVPLITLIYKCGSGSGDGNAVGQFWSANLMVVRLRDAGSVFGDEYFWSASLALSAGILATILAAWIGERERIPRGMLIILLALFCIPGPIVGLAVVSFFRLPVPGFDVLYSQTLIPTVIASLPKTLPVAFLLIRSTYRRTDPTIWQAAKLDLSPWKRWWTVGRRYMLRTYAIAILVTGILASGDVAATLPVMPAGVTTVATRLFGLLHSGARSAEATLALGYLFAITAILAVAIRIEAKSHRMVD